MKHQKIAHVFNAHSSLARAHHDALSARKQNNNKHQLSRNAIGMEWRISHWQHALKTSKNQNRVRDVRWKSSHK